MPVLLAEDLPLASEKKPGILIAASHPLYRKLLKRWFCDHGFIVWVAANGCEAVELHRLHGQDCLVLLDLCMPHLDGLNNKP